MGLCTSRQITYEVHAQLYMADYEFLDFSVSADRAHPLMKLNKRSATDSECTSSP